MKDFFIKKIQGTVDKTILSYNVRDYDQHKLEQRLNLFREVADYLSKSSPKNTIKVEVNQLCYNMRKIVEPQKHIIELAENAMKESGIIPITHAIRGCTDDSILSFKGLPCPNIFAVGMNFHGKYEYIPIRSMEKEVEVLVGIIKLNAQKL